MNCRACEIVRNDEQVKQMPEHTCGKDGPVERAQPKTAMTQFDAPNEGREKQLTQHYIDESKRILSDGDQDRKVNKIADLLRRVEELSILKLDKLISESDKLINALSEHEPLRDQLSKEREMRKELVSTINQLTRGSAFLEKKVEFLIKRASELDKNKK